MIGFDLLILAAVLGVGGSLLLAKSNMWPSFSKELAQSFYGSNPYQMRSLIAQRIEAIAGATWLCLSLPLMALGTIVTSSTSQPIETFNYLVHTLTVIGLGVIGGWLTLRITDSISRNKYVPQMVESQREIFRLSTQYLVNSGVSDDELPHQANVSAPSRKGRLATVTKWLNQIGTLIDVPRKASEADDSYHARLRPFFDK
jgi:hypothetical protein